LKKKIATKSGKKLLIELIGMALKSFIETLLNSSFLIINYLKTVSLSGIKNICEIAV